MAQNHCLSYHHCVFIPSEKQEEKEGGGVKLDQLSVPLF